MDEGFNCNGPLPPELIREILARLPVKSLLRFQSVSKGFFNLLKTPSFVSQHFHHSSQNRPLIFHKTQSLLRTQMNKVIEVHPPIPHHPNSYLRVVGSSNGLLCIAIESRSSSQEVFLWNPATMKTRRIPEIKTTHVPHDSFSSIYFSVMFGFSPLVNDHKVVFFHKSCSEARSLRFVVYSVSNESMKEIDHDDCLRHVTFRNEWVSANGALFWIGIDVTQKDNHDYRLVIVSFDLGKETFRRIKMPNYGNVVFRKIQVYKGSVAMLSYPRRGQPNYHVTLWALDDRSNNCGECWAKLYIVELVSNVERIVGVWRGEVLFEKDELRSVKQDTRANAGKRGYPGYRRVRRKVKEEIGIASLYSSNGQRKKFIATHQAGYPFRFFNAFDYAESLASI